MIHDGSLNSVFIKDNSHKSHLDLTGKNGELHRNNYPKETPETQYLLHLLPFSK